MPLFFIPAFLVAMSAAVFVGGDYHNGSGGSRSAQGGVIAASSYTTADTIKSRIESVVKADHPVSYTHLTLPTTPYV